MIGRISTGASLKSQTVAFTSTAPSPATVGGPTYSVSASASSGLPVALSVDAGASSVCSLTGSKVSFIEEGTCTIDANQAGDSNYAAAPQVQQSFAVSSAVGSTPTIKSFTPAKGKVGKKVTIKGTNLSGATAIRFNGTAATIKTDTATKITTSVPAGAKTGTISVTTPGGTVTSTKVFKVT
jgi:hypothetical protein